MCTVQLIFNSQAVCFGKKVSQFCSQYIVARYFSSETGLEQLSWLLEGQLSLEIPDDIEDLHTIDFDEFNSVSNMIKSKPLELVYKGLVNNIGMYFAFPQQCNGLIANLLIFWPSPTLESQLEDPLRVKCLFDQMSNFSKNGIGLSHDRVDPLEQML